MNCSTTPGSRTENPRWPSFALRSSAIAATGAALALREQLRASRTPMEVESIGKQLAASDDAVGSERAAELRRDARTHSLDSAVRRALLRD